MKDKKIVVYYIPATRLEALERMLNFIHNLNAANIKVGKIDTIRLQFETNNLLIKYITDHKELIGISPAEIFGADYNIDSSPLIMAKLTDHPYPGTMMDYIIDIEAIAEFKAESKEHQYDEDHDIDMVELVDFVEKVLGLELKDYQKESLKICSKRPAKVCYGRHGKIYVFPAD